MTYSNEELEAIFKGLDAECWQCKGSGKYAFGSPLERECDVCSGSGRQLTRAGVELMSFLERHREQVRGSVERAEIARAGMKGSY